MDGGVVVPPDDPAGVFDLAAFNTDWGTFGANLTTWQTDIEALLGSGGTFPTLPVPGDFVDPDLGFQLVDFLDALAVKARAFAQPGISFAAPRLN